MREIIAKVMAAESEAERLLASARETAERIRSQALRDSRSLTDRIQARVQNEGEQLLADSARATDLERDASLRRFADNLTSRFHLDAADEAGVVQDAVRSVCGLRTIQEETSPTGPDG